MNDEWDDAFDDAPDTDSSDGKPADDPPEPLYSSAEEWILKWLAPMIRRRLTNAHCWCPQWWQHAEVISRLDSIWRAWEALRLDPATGMSVWWRDHFDPHWALLSDRDRSPMAKCNPDTGHVAELDPLPVEPAPAGHWG